MKDKLVNLFMTLCKIYSPSGKEKDIVDFVFKFLRYYGFSPLKDDFGNVILKIKRSGGKPILLTAHLDTVEPCKNVKPLVKNGFVMSSGDTILGADNRATVAAILYALVSGEIKRSIEVVFTLSEEVGNYGAVNLDYSLLQSKVGYSFDSSTPVGTIILASPFYNRFDITFIGKAAHASRVDLAHNVLQALGEFLNKVKLGKINEDTIANIGVVNVGDVRNTIPGKAVLKGEVRSFKEQDLEGYSSNLKALVKEVAERVNFKYEIDIVRENPGFFYSKEDRDIQNVMKIFSKLKIPVRFEKTWGCFDANIFLQNGIKVINMGDGSIDSHTVKERISIESLFNIYRFVKLVIS